MEVLIHNDAIAKARKNLTAYAKSHDVEYVTEDAVFYNMGTGEEYHGREEIGNMLHYIYHVAFDAHAEPSNMVVTENKALLEGRIKGTHIGEFAGIPATGKQIDVPLCVTYDMEDGLIKEARIYLMGNILMEQLQ